MHSYADIYRKHEHPSVTPYTLPLYDKYFFTRDEGVIWSNSFLSAIVKVVAYINPQTEIDFERIELTDDQMRVVELAKEIRKRRALMRRPDRFCYDVQPYFYRMEMQRLKDQLDALKEIEPMYIDNPELTVCPACERSVVVGEKSLQLPDGTTCCNWDCYAVILSREHAHGD
ncbi:hypothetical protein NST07_20785 [Paenibacillus sp. FSL L8-0340]|uniref:hypothetical protein n=1 Tax=Paenibacillus sp. FSL L8-0340 TaxID=2954685 RepID=UPI0031584867